MSNCISCGMPLRSADDHPQGDTSTSYCKHCARDDGSMKSYDEVLAGMTGFLQNAQGLDAEAAQGMARGMLAKMPAWSSH